MFRRKFGRPFSNRLGAAMTMAGLASALAACSASSIEPVAPSKTATQQASHAQADEALIRRGGELSALGNCTGCHTTTDGKPLAGGLPLNTPFGKIYSTNITPDRQTGIGAWSREAFARAMREGVARDGTHLYPAFPYDHFTKVSDGDLDALYAYVMGREPVQAENHANELHFPFNIRPLVAVWNAMFLDKKPVVADSAQSAEWNRGAYLVASLGHCASCHSPRNALGAEKSGRALDGSEVDGWYAPALNHNSPSPLPWTVPQLTAYLRTGIAANHAIAGGPMQGVVHELAHVSEQDVRAIATFVVANMTAGRGDAPGAGSDAAAREARADNALKLAKAGPLAAQPMSSRSDVSSTDGARVKLGASVYADTCAACHDLGREVSSKGALQMPLAIAVHDPDPRSLIRIVTDGIKPAMGEQGRWMPDFGNALTDEQIVALATFLRSAAAPEAAPWSDLSKRVQEARQP